MKTKQILPTLLALIIRVMVSGQTPGSQSDYRTLPVLGNSKTPSIAQSHGQHKGNKDQNEIIPDKKEKVYPTLVSSEEPEVNRYFSSTSATKKESVSVTVIDNNTFNYYNNSNCYATLTFVNELLKQSEELALIEKTIRQEASAKSGEEKTKLIKAANAHYAQGELKQIQASEITGKLNLEKFSNNNQTFNQLVKTVNANEMIIDEANEVNDKAKHFIKIAKEMREEAYAMHNNSAKLGTMSNAEEKEVMALNKQEEAIGILKQYVTNLNNIPNDLAVK